MICCTTYLGSIEKDGQFEMLSSSKGNEAYIKQFTEEGLFSSDVIAENIVGLWRIKPSKDEDGKVTGTQIYHLNMFHPNGSIPNMLLGTLASAANKSIERLLKCR